MVIILKSGSDFSIISHVQGFLLIEFFLLQSVYIEALDRAVTVPSTLRPWAPCSNSNIHGYSTKNTVSKTSLYADDILFKPQSAVSVILEMVCHYGTFSGYRVSWSKSELMPLKVRDISAVQTFPFEVKQYKLRNRSHKRFLVFI